MGKMEGTFRVESRELKALVSVAHAAHKPVVKGMKNIGFFLMVLILAAIMLNHLDFVITPTLVGTGVEVTRVLITFNSCSHFTPLPPHEESSWFTELRRLTMIEQSRASAGDWGQSSSIESRRLIMISCSQSLAVRDGRKLSSRF